MPKRMFGIGIYLKTKITIRFAPAEYVGGEFGCYSY
jgi:hypothetical protein